KQNVLSRHVARAQLPYKQDERRDYERYHYNNRFFKTPLQEYFSWRAHLGRVRIADNPHQLPKEKAVAV
ncbi:hypothetical protein ACW7EJ_00085, partial [Acinetobacter soli]